MRSTRVHGIVGRAASWILVTREAPLMHWLAEPGRRGAKSVGASSTMLIILEDEFRNVLCGAVA